MSDEQDVPRSPEYQAFLDDLNQYDNPEVFHDSTLPQIYKLRIINKLLPELPTILTIEVNGDALLDALTESMFALMSLYNPDFKAEAIEEYESEDWAEAHAKMVADPDIQDYVDDMQRFYVRNLPALILRLYSILSTMSIIAPMKKLYRRPEERLSVEKEAKEILAKGVKELEKDIKRMLKVRSKGRPAKNEYAGDGAPELARIVWEIACEKMGEARGIEAVPGLKEIANELDMTDTALGKQLTRAKWPWTRIKTDLANRP